LTRFTQFFQKHRRWLIQLLGSALLLVLIFWFLPFGDIVRALSSISPAIFLSVICLFFLAHIAAAIKWWLLLGRGIPLNLAIRAHFAGLAANLCLPGAAGGDVVRATLAQRALNDGSKVLAVALVDRLIDMLALISLAGVGFVFAKQSGTNIAPITIAAVFLISVAIGIALLPKLLPLPWKIAPRLPGKTLAAKFGDAISTLGQNPVLLAALFVFSAAIQFGLVSISWCLALGVNADVTLSQWMFAWPLAKVIAVIPISLNGLGLREAALAANLSTFGANPALIVAAGLIWQAVLFIAGGIGAIILLISGMLPKASESKVKGF